MDRRVILIFATALGLTACSSGGGGTGSTTQQGMFALKSQSAAPGEAQVSLHALPAAGAFVTVISEINYDAARLHMKNCQLNPVIGDGKSGKVLSVAEPSPGMLRAVVAGTLDALPTAADVFTCTFTTSGSSGAVAIQAHGEVSDTTFEDRTFATEGTVNVAN